MKKKNKLALSKRRSKCSSTLLEKHRLISKISKGKCNPQKNLLSEYLNKIQYIVSYPCKPLDHPCVVFTSFTFFIYVL